MLSWIWQTVSSRVKRELRTDLTFTLGEDFPVEQFLPRSVYLGGFERVKGAPVVKEHLTIFANGSVKLTQRLNFELAPVVEALVIVENTETLGAAPFPLPMKSM